MDIEKVIDQLATYSSNNIYYAVCPGEVSVPKANKAYQLWKEKSDELVAYVRDLEARQFRWIPVSEGLPKCNGRALLFKVRPEAYPFGQCLKGWYEVDEDTFYPDRLQYIDGTPYTFGSNEVTHYAYIPELEELK